MYYIYDNMIKSNKTTYKLQVCLKPGANESQKR